MLDRFHELYEAAVPVGKLKPQDTEEYKLFMQKKGKEVRVFNAQKHLDFIPPYNSFYPYYQENPTSWLIPCDLPSGKVVAYVLRSMFKKEYRTYVDQGKPQLMFGLATFGSFKKGNVVVLVEGSKDCIFLNKFYPFVWGMLTAGLSKEMAKVLAALTDRVVVALDNDEGGQGKNKKRVLDNLKEQGVRTQEVVPIKKDWGQYVRFPGLEDVARTQLKLAFMRLGAAGAID